MPLSDKIANRDLIKYRDELQVGLGIVSKPGINAPKPTGNFKLGAKLSMTTMKIPEDEKAGTLIVRFCNFSEDVVCDTFECFADIKDAEICNMLEEKIAKADFNGKVLELTLNPWEVKTYRLYFK